MSSIIYYIIAVCFTALAHPSSTRHRSTATCGMPMNNIWRSNRTYMYYKYIGIMIYIDRWRSVFFFFVLLSKLIQKYKQPNYRYYYFAMHRLLSRQAEISTCIIDLPVHTSLLRLQYYTHVLYFILWQLYFEGTTAQKSIIECLIFYTLEKLTHVYLILWKLIIISFLFFFRIGSCAKIPQNDFLRPNK